MKYGNESKVNPLLLTQEKIGVLYSLSFNSVLPAASHLQMINTFLLLPPISLLDLSSLTQQFAMALGGGFITEPVQKWSLGTTELKVN